MTLIARIAIENRSCYAELHGDEYAELDAAPWRDGRANGLVWPRQAARLLAPVEPSKILCIGLNYRAHVAESVTAGPGAEPPSEPLVFMKPPSAIIGPGQAIRYPRGVTRLDPEGEVAIVIGRRARHVSESEAARCVAGVTALNDVSARNYQRSDGQWTRAKGFDTFAPIGPYVALGVEPGSLTVSCRVNGTLRQRGVTSDLLFPVPMLIQFLSGIMTLEPGDVIATGTPAGVAPIVVGDRVEVEVERVGILENVVAGDDA